MKRELILGGVLVLVLVAGVLIAITPAWAAATITVTTTSDVIATDGLCSLREAIIAANTDSAYGDCPGGSGADTIDFAPNLPEPANFVLTNDGANEDSAMTGDLDIVGTLTINGTGMDQIIIDGNGTDRVLEIRPGAHITITRVTVRNGNPGAAADGGGIKVLGALTLSDSAIDANQGDGIRNDGGLLRLNNVSIVNNTGGYGLRNQNAAYSEMNGGMVSGNQGGGVYNAVSSVTLNNLSIVGNAGGGGVHNSGMVLTYLTMNQCMVTSNAATSGGGIFNEGIGARANIYDTQISSNTATGAGGGVFNNGIMTLNGSTIRNNQARSGGGIDHFGGNLYLTNTTISGNDAGDNGGGLHNRSTSLLTNVTFSGNTADGPDTGGNIFNDEAQLSIVNSIVAHSPIDGNCFNSEGSLQSLGHNLDSANSCGFGAAGDLTNVDPRLGPLQDNGGPTWTHALLADSPAIGAGDNSACPDTDQRGVPRPQGTTCDIGAYEATEAADVADLSIDKTRVGTGTVAPGEQITYTLGLFNAGPAAPVSAIVVDTWTPAAAVVGVDAPGCTVDLAGGVVTCSYAALGLGKLVPEPVVVLTTDRTFSGVLSNTATIAPSEGAIDANPSNNTSQTIVVTIVQDARIKVYLPLIANNSSTAD